MGKVKTPLLFSGNLAFFLKDLIPGSVMLTVWLLEGCLQYINAHQSSIQLGYPTWQALYNQKQIPIKSREYFCSSGACAILIYLWKVRLFWPFLLMHMMKWGAEMKNNIL